MKTITQAIADAVLPPSKRVFLPSRYPWTYAADFLRQHPEIVPKEVWIEMIRTAPSLPYSDNKLPQMSRAESAGVRRTWSRMLEMSDVDAAVQLADAMLGWEGIPAPPSDEREYLIKVARGLTS